MIQMEELYEKILAELDLSKEVEDDELVEIIHRTLRRKGKRVLYTIETKIRSWKGTVQIHSESLIFCRN
mgnify:CR=1 FL=1